MKEFFVTLRSVGDVKDFVALASVQPFEVTVGYYRQRVNGKSFMQMFCLDLSVPQQVLVDCTDEEFCGFYDAAERFRTKY